MTVNRKFILAVLLKRAPGVDCYDFSQTIVLPFRELQFDVPVHATKNLRTEYEFYGLMVGFDLKFQLISTHGDIHYIGLNGIEVLDHKGQVIQGQVGAEPSSIRVLQQMKGDRRVVENLIDGTNDTQDDSHMWLTPFTNRCFDHS